MTGIGRPAAEERGANRPPQVSASGWRKTMYRDNPEMIQRWPGPKGPEVWTEGRQISGSWSTAGPTRSPSQEKFSDGKRETRLRKANAELSRFFALSILSRAAAQAQAAALHYDPSR